VLGLVGVQEVHGDVVEDVRVGDRALVDALQQREAAVQHPAFERGLGGDGAYLDVRGVGLDHLLQVIDRLVEAAQPDVGEPDLLVDDGREVGPQGEQPLVLDDRVLVALRLEGVLGLGQRLEDLRRGSRGRRPLELDPTGASRVVS